MVAICLGLLNIPFQRAYADSNGQFDSLQGTVAIEKSKNKKGVIVSPTPETDEIRARNLENEDAQFALEMEPCNTGHKSIVIEDFIKPGRFMGYPVLIKLGDGLDDAPSISALTSDLKQTVSDLTSIQSSVKTAFGHATEQPIIDVVNEQIKQSLAHCQKEQRSESNTDIPVKYLLVFNYNIPALTKGLFLGHDYRSVRVSANIFLRTSTLPSETQQLLSAPNPSPPGVPGYTTPYMYLGDLRDNSLPSSASMPSTPSSAVENYWPVRIGSIYPTYDELTADMVNQRTLTLQAQPEWAGVGAGSITYSQMHQESYQQKLPTVVGMAEPFGRVQWIYYPAKSQQIAFGNKTAFAILYVPRKLSETINQTKPPTVGVQMDVKMEYQLKGLDFGKVARMQRLYISLANAVDGRKRIDMVRRTYGRLLPVSDEMQLERILLNKDPADIFNSQKASDTNKTPETPAKTPVPQTAAPSPKPKGHAKKVGH